MDVPLSSAHVIPLVQLGSPAVSCLAPGSGKCHGKNDNKQAQLGQSSLKKERETGNRSHVHGRTNAAAATDAAAVHVTVQRFNLIIITEHKYCFLFLMSTSRCCLISTINNCGLAPPVGAILQLCEHEVTECTTLFLCSNSF